MYSVLNIAAAPQPADLLPGFAQANQMRGLDSEDATAIDCPLPMAAHDFEFFDNPKGDASKARKFNCRRNHAVRGVISGSTNTRFKFSGNYQGKKLLQ